MRSSFTLFSVAALASALAFTSSAEAGAHQPYPHKASTHSRMLQKRSYSGQGTFYNTETGNAGSCGNYLKNTGYTVAVNTPQYTSSWCGKTITITANGKTHTATIEDECPGDGTTCKYGALDMSPALFKYFADESVGVIDISWSMGDLVGDVVNTITGNDDDDDDKASKVSLFV